MVLHFKDYSELFKDLQKFWSFGQSERYLTNDLLFIKKHGRKIFIAYACSVFVTCYLYTFTPILQWKRATPADWYEICDLQNNACFAFTYGTQFCNITGIYFTNAGYDGLFFMLLFYVYCDLKMIQNGFKYLNYLNKDQEELYRDFNILVNHHAFILKYKVHPQGFI